MSFRDQNINWPSSSFGYHRNFPSDKFVQDFNDGLRTRTLSSSGPRSFNTNISDDLRSQNRSMSEPPEDRPNNSESTSINNNTNQKPKCQQVRQIPIFVEGRDVPVLARDFTKDSAPPEQLFGQENVSFHNNMGNKTSSVPRPPTTSNKQRRADIEIKPEFITKKAEKVQDTCNELNQPQQQQQQQQQQQPQKRQENSIEKIQTIQKNVLSLINEVEQFQGNKNDKKYLYLDEMFTRNLLNLDNIDTEGKENIRKARKEAIKCIESCISLLEKKAEAANKDDSIKQEENTETRAVLVPKEEIEEQRSNTAEEAMDQDCDQVEVLEQNAKIDEQETRAVLVENNSPIENRAVLVENSEKQDECTPSPTATHSVTNQN